MAMEDGYPFVFSMYDKTEINELEELALQYKFRSSKSNHTYIVRVEKYKQHSYCLKFYDKANRNSLNKYSLRTNTFESRTIFYTLYHIMLDVLEKDPLASFFFIGAEDEKDEQGKSTRRYKIYRTFVSSIISNRLFEHYRSNALSLYILVNKRSVEDTDTFAKYIENIVKTELENS